MKIEHLKHIEFGQLNTDHDVKFAFLSCAIKLDDLPDYEHFQTNIVKYNIYSRTFPVEFREKYTGFEFVSQLDSGARSFLSTADISMSSTLVQDMGTEDTNFEYIFKEIKAFDDYHNIQTLEDAIDVYRSILIEKAKKYRGLPNVLYYSGGLDSEMVLWSFMEAGVDFVPVTFEYIDNEGNYVNKHDTVWADKFCKQHKLNQIKRTLNIEKFLNSEHELIHCAEIMKCRSPQMATHAKLVELVHDEIEVIGFDQFAQRKTEQLGKISIPNFRYKQISDIKEVAPDIWTLQLFDENTCDKLINLLKQEKFSPQPGDNLPIEELMLKDFDEIFYTAYVNFVENQLKLFYYTTYSNVNFSVLTSWFNRLGDDVQTQNIENNSVAIHHDQARVSMSLVLNEDFEGGELFFPRQNFKTTYIPKGTLIMWPGQITHPHTVLPVNMGTRYCLVTFIKLEKFSTRELQLSSNI